MRDVYSISFNSMEWSEHEEGLLYKRERHACGILRNGDKKIVVVAGGSNFDDYLSSVEILLVIEEATDTFALNWEYGPDLPMPMTDAAGTTTSDQQSLYIIGGTMFLERSNYVLKLVCSDVVEVNCIWTKIDHELKAETAMGLALAMPQIQMSSRKHQNALDCSNGSYLHIYQNTE